MYRKYTALIFILVFVALAPFRATGQNNVTRYVYDDNGRLRAVVASNGEANIYDYDAAGNITGVRKVPATHLELFAFNPHQGVPGTQVTFIGVGFGVGVTGVSFNGTPAQAFSFNLTTLTATVPDGATSGLITITTVNGSVTTAEPFLIKGVSISPVSALVAPGESQQFQSTVFTLDPDTSVRWSVNGIEGGNNNIGTITVSGLYTAPNLPFSAIIRATSNSDPTLFAEAQVAMRSINGLRFPVSSGVLVKREVEVQPTVPTNSAVSSGVLIRRQTDTISETSTNSAISSGVLIRRDNPLTPDISTNSAISSGVLINREADTAPDVSSNSAFSSGVLVQRETPVTPNPDNQVSTFSSGVLVRRDETPTGEPITSSSISNGVLVQRGEPGMNEPNYLSSVSGGVLVRREVPIVGEPTILSAASSGVLIRRETPITFDPTSTFIASNGVLVTNGAIVNSVSPNQISRDTTFTITITGVNLSGATSVKFVNSEGGIDDLIVTSNITVNQEGTALTATVTVGPSAALGNRFVVVQTTRGQSFTITPNANIVTIQ